MDIDQILEKNGSLENISVESFVDDFLTEYSLGEMDFETQIESLEFINTVFKLKHKLIMDGGEKKSIKRNMQKFYLRKIKKIAEGKIKKHYIYKKREFDNSNEDIKIFKLFIRFLKKSEKEQTNNKTRQLIKELMKSKSSVKNKILFLKNVLRDKYRINFSDMTIDKNKDEIISSFIAVLDLIKKNQIDVYQERNFEEIVIKKKN